MSIAAVIAAASSSSERPTWDWEFVRAFMPRLLDGLVITIEATLIAMALALVLGLVVAVIRYSRVPVVSHIFTFYVRFVRGTPLLVQLFFAFFGISSLGFVYPAFATGVVVLGINYSAYTAEVYRSGVEDVPKGQWEASQALSFATGTTWGRVILPQALRAVIPMLGNYLVQMFKDSALLFTITIAELMYQTKYVAKGFTTDAGQRFPVSWIEPMTIAAAIYLVISLVASLLIRGLESKLALKR